MSIHRHEDEQEEGQIIRALLSELGYEFTLADACEFWADASEDTASAGWLCVVTPQPGWRERTKVFIYRRIASLRRVADGTLKRFPSPPKTWK